MCPTGVEDVETAALGIVEHLVELAKWDLGEVDGCAHAARLHV
jgi:hypothetical protein